MRQLPDQVQEILRRLEGAGYEAWCVGGAVRDALLGLEPGDWDVTTSAPPEAVLDLFGPNALPTGLRHGTVTVGGGRGVEVTTFRRDGDYLDNRHPDHVEFTGSLTEDLARRDFTVNAIAVNLRGDLADPSGGREDLQARLLRAVGEPERRFGEDALRILRGLRFASRLGFSVESDTAAALHNCAPLLRHIAPERIREELTGILCGGYVREVLLAYSDVLGVFLPEILPCVGFDQHSVYHCYDVWEHTAMRWRRWSPCRSCAGPCCSTTWASRRPSPWTGRAGDTSTDIGGAASPWRRLHWTGCGWTTRAKRPSSPW